MDQTTFDKIMHFFEGCLTSNEALHNCENDFEEVYLQGLVKIRMDERINAGERLGVSFMIQRANWLLNGWNVDLAAQVARDVAAYYGTILPKFAIYVVDETEEGGE